mmetsp:Transcript_34406/g.75282  ORF Transcript_34406/g.75282 Transcript_34406/m.75282 type:complete len:336 (-) Transcript_34406:668-1675(-)
MALPTATLPSSASSKVWALWTDSASRRSVASWSWLCNSAFSAAISLFSTFNFLISMFFCTMLASVLAMSTNNVSLSPVAAAKSVSQFSLAVASFSPCSSSLVIMSSIRPFTLAKGSSRTFIASAASSALCRVFAREVNSCINLSVGESSCTKEIGFLWVCSDTAGSERSSFETRFTTARMADSALTRCPSSLTAAKVSFLVDPKFLVTSPLITSRASAMAFSSSVRLPERWSHSVALFSHWVVKSSRNSSSSASFVSSLILSVLALDFSSVASEMRVLHREMVVSSFFFRFLRLSCARSNSCRLVASALSSSTFLSTSSRRSFWRTSKSSLVWEE